MGLDDGVDLFGISIEFLEFDPSGMELVFPQNPWVEDAIDLPAEGRAILLGGRTVQYRMRGKDRSELFQRCGGGRRILRKK